MSSHFDKQVDRIRYPHLETTGIEGSESFVRGLLSEALFEDTHIGEHLNEAAHYYTKALDEGSMEAGVNLMRILVKAQESASIEGNFDLKSQFKYVSEKLTAMGHPIMPYYEALMAILSDGKENEGWVAMEKLVSCNNPYAVTVCTLEDALEDYLPDEEEED